MSTPSPIQKQPRPQPDPIHRKQTFWQIWLPLMLSIAAILFLAGLAVVATMNNNQTATEWAHLSAIYMIIPVLIISFIILVVLCAIAYGLARLLDILPVYTRITQSIFRKMSLSIHKWSDKASQPVLTFKSWWAGIESALKHIGL
jgi:lysylphosphatidylglycerol synthetase-like protein (DUF2156 family)